MLRVFFEKRSYQILVLGGYAAEKIRGTSREREQNFRGKMYNILKSTRLNTNTREQDGSKYDWRGGWTRHLKAKFID